MIIDTACYCGHREDEHEGTMTAPCLADECPCSFYDKDLNEL